MSLLQKKSPNRPLPHFTFLGCPMTKNKTPWCFRMCAPQNGIGQCGRIAAHSLSGRTQEAIRSYNEAMRLRAS